MWHFKNFSDNTAIITECGQEYSYAVLDKACNDLVSQVNRRCLVFNLCSNTIGSLVGYTGFLNARIVPLMLDDNIDAELLDNFLNLYKPDYLWLPKSRADKFAGKVVYEAFDYALLEREDKSVFPLHEDLALLLTTSGSTGSPKLVRQSYANIKANFDSIVEYLKIDATERPITTLPMNYTYGISILNSHLAVGASIILTTKTLMQREFWDAFSQYKATSFGGVPYTYEMLNRLRFFNRDLPSLKTMTQAGGKLSPELHKKFAEFASENGKQFIVMYGQTEATARMAYLPAEKSIEKYGSMGVAIPSGKFSLIDVDGNEVTEPEIVGELVYEGANVTLGYAEKGEDLAKGDERFGKLITGDMAKRDADGFYYVVGRKKRFLKIFGNRVNLDETERLIKHHFDGLDCACAGKDDAMYIFITDEAKIKEVKTFVAEKSHINHSAFNVQYIEAVPKNESGKTVYTGLEKFYA